MKQKIVGVFPCGFEDIQIVLREGTGGEFYNRPGKGEIPRMKLGADDTWEMLVSSFIHEAFEFMMMRLKCRYQDNYAHVLESSGYLFVMDHVTFSDVCSRVGQCATNALPALCIEYRKWNKK